MRQRRRWAIGGMTFAAAGIVMAAAAWACVSGPVVNLSPAQARAGQEVTITGSGFPVGNQAQVRWNALDGPVLATVAPPLTGGNLTATFTVPEGTRAGNYVVIITQQNSAGQLALSPVRSVMSVVGPAGGEPIVGASGAKVDAAPRAASLARSEETISAGALGLIALGAGGVAMFLAGMAALLAGRRSTAPEAARARR